MNELGFYVLRFHDEEVMNDIDNVIRVIEKYMDEFKSGHPPSFLGGKSHSKQSSHWEDFFVSLVQ